MELGLIGAQNPGGGILRTYVLLAILWQPDVGWVLAPTKPHERAKSFIPDAANARVGAKHPPYDWSVVV